MNSDAGNFSFVEFEKRGQGKLGAQFAYRYFSSMEGVKFWLPLVLVLIACESSLPILFRWLLTEWSAGSTSFGLVFVTLTVVSGVVVRCLAWTLSLVFMTRGARVLHDRAAQSFSLAPVTFFDQHPSGRLLRRFSDDYEKVKREIPNYMLDILSGTADLLWAVVFVLINVPLLIGVALPCAWIYKNLQEKFTNTSRELQRLTKILESPAWSLFTESVSESAGLSIRVFGRTSQFVQRLGELQGRYARALLASSRVTRWLNVRLKLTSEAFALAVALFCIYGLENQLIAVGLAGFLMSLSIGLDGTMQWVTRAVSLLEPAMVAVERLVDFGMVASEPGSARGDETGRRVGTAAKLPTAHAVPLLELKNLTVAYRADLPAILHGVNLKIDPGLRVGIIGRTGAGKSTLFQALFRMTHVLAGDIALDGVSLNEMPLDVARSFFTIVPQDPVLFSGSLRYNLDRLGMHSDERLWQALGDVGLESWVAQLPGALSYELSEGASNLSQGERQLLCIARAALQVAPIVLLDEATASVDHHTDRRVGDAIRKAFAGRTLLVIAHRLDTVKSCDLLVAMSQGRIVKLGEPAEVLNSLAQLRSLPANSSNATFESFSDQVGGVPNSEAEKNSLPQNDDFSSWLA